MFSCSQRPGVVRSSGAMPRRPAAGYAPVLDQSLRDAKIPLSADWRNDTFAATALLESETDVGFTLEQSVKLPLLSSLISTPADAAAHLANVDASAVVCQYSSHTCAACFVLCKILMR